jgi:hypothetical protein
MSDDKTNHFMQLLIIHHCCLLESEKNVFEGRKTFMINGEYCTNEWQQQSTSRAWIYRLILIRIILNNLKLFSVVVAHMFEFSPSFQFFFVSSSRSLEEIHAMSKAWETKEDRLWEKLYNYCLAQTCRVRHTIFPKGIHCDRLLSPGSNTF